MKKGMGVRFFVRRLFSLERDFSSGGNFGLEVYFGGKVDRGAGWTVGRDMSTNETCFCRFCKKSIAREDACVAGWIPYFYVGEAEVSAPVCPVCGREKLVAASDGEMALREDASEGDRMRALFGDDDLPF